MVCYYVSLFRLLYKTKTNMLIILKIIFLIEIFNMFFSIFFSRDFAHKLSLSLIANTNTLLHTIDLSNNLIEDKGNKL